MALRIWGLAMYLFTDSLFEIQQTHWAQLGERKGKAGSPILILPLRPRQILSHKSMVFLPLHKEKWAVMRGQRSRRKGKGTGWGQEGEGNEGGEEEGGRGRVVIDSSPSLPPCLNLCSFLMPGPVICSHWSLLMFFNYIRDTFGNMFVNTKPSQILPLVTLHKSCPSSLRISCQSKESVRELHTLGPGLACFLFFVFFLSKSEHSSFFALWGKGNLPLQGRENWVETREQLYMGSHRGHCWQLCSGAGVGGYSTESWTHQPSLSLAIGTEYCTPQRRSLREACIQILSQISKWTIVNFVGSPRPIALQHFHQDP